jgi:hypothetical protein
MEKGIDKLVKKGYNKDIKDKRGDSNAVDTTSII